MNPVKTGEIYMDDNDIRIKIWPILTRTYHLFTAKLGPSISMIWTWIKKVSKTALSLVWSLFQVALSYLISCFPTAHAFGVCLYQRFFKKSFPEPMCRICRRTNYSCGTVLVIGLACIVLIGWLV